METARQTQSSETKGSGKPDDVTLLHAKLIPELVIGLGVNIIAAVIYDRTKDLYGPIAVFGCLALIVGAAQTMLLRNAYRKAEKQAAESVRRAEIDLNEQFSKSLDV